MSEKWVMINISKDGVNTYSSKKSAKVLMANTLLEHGIQSSMARIPCPLDYGSLSNLHNSYSGLSGSLNLPYSCMLEVCKDT